MRRVGITNPLKGLNNMSAQPEAATGKAGYNRFLLFVAGLGGLLYGIDVGIIAGALP